MTPRTASMWTSLVMGLFALALCVLAWRYRRAYLRELPLRVWDRDYPDAESVAVELERETGLARRQLPAGLTWLGDLLVSPVWLFWGDLRSSRPERRLSRWRLEGRRADERAASLQLGPDLLCLAVACRARGALWVELGAAFEAQEGLRGLHPVGGEHWRSGTAHLAALGRRGQVRLIVETGVLSLDTPVDAQAPMQRACGFLLDELAALARVLEA